MQLPGGVWQNQQLDRRYRFHPLSGLLEFEVGQIVEQGLSLPQTVDKILVSALADLAGCQPNEQDVAALCIADRQFLMRQLQLHFGDEQKWFSAQCQHCGETFDFELDVATLPVSQGNEQYPYVALMLQNHLVTFRLPNGHDQYALACIEQSQAQIVILQHCVQQDCLDFDAANFVAELSDTEMTMIEQAMDQASPGIVTEITAICIHCDGANCVHLDPYGLLNRGYGNLLADIHTIASQYHWSEQDILALSAQRRQSYLQMIDRGRGMSA